MIYLKLLISGVFIAWVLFGAIDPSQFSFVLSKVDLKLILLALGMRLFGFLLSSLRWQKLLSSQAVHMKFLLLLDSYIIASFFNLFMPTRVGGDMYRINDLRHNCESVSHSASSVFIERFLGIVILLIFALIASLFQLSLAREIPTIWIGLLIGISGLSLLFFALYSTIIERMIKFIPRPEYRSKLSSQWQIFRKNAILLLSTRESLMWGLWYSFLLQINVVIHYWIVGKALGFSVPLLNYFFLIPIQLVILMLPSINGIGLREASSIVLFSYYGITATEATFFALIDLIMMLIIGCIGWGRFLSRGSLTMKKNKLSSTSSILKTPQ